MTPLAWRSQAELLGELPLSIGVGTIVRTGQNSHPHYQVIAISEDRAWVRDVQSGTDHVLPTARCQKI